MLKKQKTPTHKFAEWIKKAVKLWIHKTKLREAANEHQINSKWTVSQSETQLMKTWIEVFIFINSSLTINFRVFASNVWAFLLFALFLLSSGFLICYIIYRDVLQRHDLIRRCRDYVDFFLIPYASFTEPDPLPWFPKISAGKMKSKTSNYLNIICVFLWKIVNHTFCVLCMKDIWLW